MSIILKTGKSYTDPAGRTHTEGTDNPIMTVVSAVVLNKSKCARYDVCIYNSASDRDSGKACLQKKTMVIKPVANVDGNGDPDGTYDHTVFNTYFEDSVMKAADTSLIERCYTHLGLAQPQIPGIVWGDWKCDESGGVPMTIPRQ